MHIKQSEFIISAARKDQFPIDGLNEIAFVGRSNVGKSSIINALTNRRHLAKTSQTPGKTRLVNFFLINNNFHLVDLPGYGYAKVSKKEKDSWVYSIEAYLINRLNLKKVVLLVDCRHDPTAQDIQMLEWIRHYGYRVVVVATKTDKLSKNELFKNLKNIKTKMNLREEEELLSFSSLNKKGRDELVDALFDDVQTVQE